MADQEEVFDDSAEIEKDSEDEGTSGASTQPKKKRKNKEK